LGKWLFGWVSKDRYAVLRNRRAVQPIRLVERGRVS
jgi:hypothetical protein